MIDEQAKQNSASTDGSTGRWIFLLIAGFYLNDIVFILWSGTDKLYLADYAIRVAIIGICLSTSYSRKIVWSDISTNRLPVLVVIGLILILIASERLASIMIGPEIVEAIGNTGLFYFGRIENPKLYLFDITVGLAPVSYTHLTLPTTPYV